MSRRAFSPPLLAALAAAVASLPLACHGTSIGEATGDSAAIADVGDPGFDAGSDTMIDGDASVATGCPTLHGPKMVRIDASGGPFCIDTTEVTIAQYNEFLRADGTPYDAPKSICQDKPSERPTPDDTPASQSFAAGHVTWCYAYAFCKWSGKRLCGRIGGGHAADGVPAGEDEWTFACRNGTKLLPYPYGTAYDPSLCNTEDGGIGAAHPQCHGQFPPFDQIFDMIGNVAEFEDFTLPDYPDDAGPIDVGTMATHTRGGWNTVGKMGDCVYSDAFGVGTSFEDTGFRCCADAR